MFSLSFTKVSQIRFFSFVIKECFFIFLII